MKLNSTSFGEETGTPLLIVHGLFGSSRNWRALAKHFSRRRWVVTVDLRNHGSSPWGADNSYEAMAADLAELIPQIAPKADVLGHSMGGKAAMVLALIRPELVARLLIADIAPVAYAHSQSENIAIMKALPLHEFERKSQAQAALFKATGDDALAAFFAQSIVFGEETPRWQLNLTALEENMDKIIGFPDINGQYDGQTFVICGGSSDYVDETGLAKIAYHFPNRHIHTLEGAGHWLHAEKPKEFISDVQTFLDAEG